MPRILVLEDDPDIGAALDFNLRKEGYDVHLCVQGAQALRYLGEREVHLALLDVMLPDIGGLDVCRQIRSNNLIADLPVIMLTARGADSDRLLGLECGADDYVVKPFLMQEVLLRVRAMLRRSGALGESVERLESGQIVVDQTAHRVFVEGHETPLTHTEYKLLTAFLRRPGRVYSREQLLDHVWNMPWSVVTRTVDTHVKRLREKLGSHGELIETVRGVGYRFAPRISH
jgi:two-component system phosphate regulon response regulator PhoB